MADTLLKPGDVVELRGSGVGQRMTVDRVWTDRMASSPPPTDWVQVRCVWFAPDGKLCDGPFNPDALVLA